MKYNVRYTKHEPRGQVNGTVPVEAESARQAEDKFYDAQTEPIDYDVVSVKEA